MCESPHRGWTIAHWTFWLPLLGLPIYPVCCISSWDAAAREFSQAIKPFVELGGYATGPEMGPLAGIASIEVVRLDRTKTKDDDLLRLRSHLESLPNLRVLQLDKTEITDKGLAHLVGLNGLECLFLHQTSVTPQGVADLQRRLPKCKIEYGPY